jgi:tetratricopeptide (TPR) repeat protein
MRFELTLSAAIVWAWIAAPAAAQGTEAYAAAWTVAESADPNAKICHDKSGDEAIAGCTAAIQSGKLSGIGLAIVFYGRGYEYQGQEKAAQAIADYSEAIRLDRGKVGPFFNRGGLYHQQKDYVRAIADYSEAIRINPQEAAAFSARGWAERRIGKTAEGDADIARACSLDSEYCESGTR